MSEIQVPVALQDYQGRILKISVPIDAPQVLVGVQPIGVFCFHRTDEKTPTGRRIFKQQPAPLTQDQIDEMNAKAAKLGMS